MWNQQGAAVDMDAITHHYHSRLMAVSSLQLMRGRNKNKKTSLVWCSSEECGLLTQFVLGPQQRHIQSNELSLNSHRAVCGSWRFDFNTQPVGIYC